MKFMHGADLGGLSVHHELHTAQFSENCRCITVDCSTALSLAQMCKCKLAKESASITST